MSLCEGESCQLSLYNSRACTKHGLMIQLYCHLQLYATKSKAMKIKHQRIGGYIDKGFSVQDSILPTFVSVWYKPIVEECHISTRNVERKEGWVSFQSMKNMFLPFQRSSKILILHCSFLFVLLFLREYFFSLGLLLSLSNKGNYVSKGENWRG